MGDPEKAEDRARGPECQAEFLASRRDGMGGPARAAYQAGQHQHERVLDDTGEYHRGDQCVEDPAEEPSDSDPEVEVGQPAGRGSAAGDLPVAEETCEEQGEQVEREEHPKTSDRSRHHRREQRHHQYREQPVHEGERD